MENVDENVGKHKIQIPEEVIRFIQEKDKAMKMMARKIRNFEKQVEKLKERDALTSRRISQLQYENEKVIKERDTLSTKLTLLSYKLQMSSPIYPKPYGEGSTPTPASPGLASGATPSKHCKANSTTSPSGYHGNVTSSRPRSHKKVHEDEKVKRSRAWANAYELSQDLHDKQLEMLERKYGGQLRARRAARVIQQAYRQYCMNKNFNKLRSEVEERRLSRRFTEFGRSKTIWSDMVNNIEKEMGMHSRYYSSEEVSRAEDSDNHVFTRTEDTVNEHGAIHKEYTQTTNCSRSIRVMHKSHSLQMNSRDIRLQDKKYQRALGLDLSTINEHTKGSREKVSAAIAVETNRDSYNDFNDSSASDSPQGTPVEPHVDLPSVNFESLLESKETDILNDSFHSDSSQELATPHGMSPLMSPVSMGDSTHNPCHLGGRTYENFHSQYSDSSLHRSHRSSVHSDTKTSSGNAPPARPETARIPIQGAGAVYTKVPLYDNSEVRLRKQRNLPANQGLHPNHQSDPTLSATQDHSIANKSKNGQSDASPIWKRKSSMDPITDDAKRMSNISEASEPDSERKSIGSFDGRSMGSLDERGSRDGLSSQGSDTASMGSHEGNTYNRQLPMRSSHAHSQTTLPRVTDRERKRAYRIGLNLFNKKPEKGVRYLMEHRFIDFRPMSVAKFLLTRKGLSKQMIGEYLGNLQKDFNQEVLECFADQIDLSGLQIDVALRGFQSYFRMPGEAQKIERLMEAFASRYCMCNPDQVKTFKNPDTVFLLAFAIIMLNTDLHNKSIKEERKMKVNDFVRNLRGIDNGQDLDPDLLHGIYDRIRACEFKPGSDHVSQVLKVDQMIVGKKPVRQLALPQRRLVCYCRLYEVNDPNKKEKLGLHQREVFLFNDQLLVTKIHSKKKSSVTYAFRQSIPLNGMQVYLFETSHYKHGVRLTTNIDGKVLITFNARNEHDRSKFVEDLKEAILEMNEMENQRIAEELHRQRVATNHHQYHHPHSANFNRHSKDSGVVDIDLLRISDTGSHRLSAPECSGMKKNALSNSLIDLTEASRRGSGGSLDSGMASEGRGSQEDNSNAVLPTTGLGAMASGFYAAKNTKPQHAKPQQQPVPKGKK